MAAISGNCALGSDKMALSASSSSFSGRIHPKYSRFFAASVSPPRLFRCSVELSRARPLLSRQLNLRSTDKIV
ncbi:hypothetical protein Patl1_09176 [Pistacia atlantica]|uniref:Uncharacterized protein n=1 Tax=Pistacia atlantica TaxID=434234 RepID=A0ACC1AIB2_9ROSI|nr:hypothetical protein Patl1_09176 [Pistacia atlantica]